MDALTIDGHQYTEADFRALVADRDMWQQNAMDARATVVLLTDKMNAVGVDVEEAATALGREYAHMLLWVAEDKLRTMEREMRQGWQNHRDMRRRMRTALRELKELKK